MTRRQMTIGEGHRPITDATPEERDETQTKLFSARGSSWASPANPPSPPLTSQSPILGGVSMLAASYLACTRGSNEFSLRRMPFNRPLREPYACELDYRRGAGHATLRAPSLASRTRSATPPTYLMPAGFGSLQTQRGRRDHEERLTEALALASECQAFLRELHPCDLNDRREVGHAHRGLGPGLEDSLGNPAASVTEAGRCRPDTPRDGGVCGVPAGVGMGSGHSDRHQARGWEWVSTVAVLPGNGPCLGTVSGRQQNSTRRAQGIMHHECSDQLWVSSDWPLAMAIRTVAPQSQGVFGIDRTYSIILTR
ncbi:hypothetical protein EDB85DRAFT_1893954 [Lactarius pseudohatsudake]|nr:hypothetical protein EDB85DRAFT_1893954 [Lactarius pseudohatsudake]